MRNVENIVATRQKTLNAKCKTIPTDSTGQKTTELLSVGEPGLQLVEALLDLLDATPEEREEWLRPTKK
jgi:hypothetical protein